MFSFPPVPALRDKNAACAHFPMTKSPFPTPPSAACPNSLSAPAPLRFFVVQASEADFDRIIREEGGALGHASIRVETPQELRELLGTEALQDCDLVVANDLPDLDPSAAVKILRAGCDEIPVIVLLGDTGEDRAVELMRAGASDCVRKSQFGRLAPAVRRELRHAKTRREFQEAHEDITARKQAEADLLWKAAFFEAQSNSSIDGILVVDQQGRHILQNQRMRDLFKIPPHIAGENNDEQQLRWVAGVIQNAEQFIERVTYLYAHPNEISRDEVKLKDGTTLDRYSSPVFGRKGEYYGRLWTFRDVTAARKAEEALRESEERFSGAFEHAPIGIALASLEGRWIKANRALCNLVGYSEAELVTRNFRDITHPEDLEASVKNLQEIIAGKTPSSHLEKRYVHQKGHSVMVNLSLSLVHDRHGHPSYFIAQIQDITERKQAEILARDSQAQYRSLIDNASDAIFSVAPNGTFTSLNPAAETIVGLSRADWIGKPFAPTLHPDDLPLAREMMHRILQGKQAPVHELRTDPGLNRPAILEVTLAGQKDESGKIIGVLGIGRDITERKRTEESLRERARLAALDAGVKLALARGETLARTLRFTCEEIVHHLDAAFARVWILNEQEKMLELAASAGMYTHLDGAHGRVPVGKFKIGLIAEERKPHLTNHVVGDPRVGHQDWAKREGMVAFAGYPLLIEGHLVGVVAMFARHTL